MIVLVWLHICLFACVYIYAASLCVCVFVLFVYGLFVCFLVYVCVFLNAFGRSYLCEFVNKRLYACMCVSLCVCECVFVNVS